MPRAPETTVAGSGQRKKGSSSRRRKLHDNNNNKPSRSFSWHDNYFFLLSLHLVCLSIYTIPIFVWKSEHDKGSPVLDELHIVTPEQIDIYSSPSIKPTTELPACHDKDDALSSISCWIQTEWSALTEDSVWINDYWGRPMNSASSHKSWRPFTILSFRYLRFPGLTDATIPFLRQWNWDDLVSHRVVNILLHALTAEWVALLALLLFCPNHAYAQRERRRLSRQKRDWWIWQTSEQTDNKLSTSSSSSNNINGDDRVVDNMYSFWLYTLTKLLFCLHPTHVEVTANAANRPHLIAVACTAVLANPCVPWYFTPILAAMGLLSAETFLFGIVPAAGTLLVVTYRQQFTINETATTTSPQSPPTLLHQTLWTIRQCGLRITIMVVAALFYYRGRQEMDWLSIPTGLIRPAENPYFRLTGHERIVNYAYVTALHIAKSWDMDWVGFSHEYGYECLTPIESFEDNRLAIPIAAALVLLVLPSLWFMIFGRYSSIKMVTCIVNKKQRTEPQPQSTQQIMHVWSTPFLFWLFHLSWLATLFPIMGIVKVGTFVADRIAVTSSSSACILVAHVLAWWLASSWSEIKRRREATMVHFSFSWIPFVGEGESDCSSALCIPIHWRVLLISGLLSVGWRRIHLRTWEWMDPVPLLQSSLKTCPRSAKSHLEISKIYSGLYAEYYNLRKANWHLEQVEKIDPTYCDVHFQFAHVAVQDQEYLEVENRLVQALLCQYTTNQAMQMWNRYWEMAMGSPNSPAYRRNEERRIAYHKEIRQKLEEDEKKRMEDGDVEGDDSHFVRWRG